MKNSKELSISQESNPKPLLEKFNELAISQQLIANLTAINHIVMTPIQASAIPLALSGNDVVGTAQTGTGKTAAFVIPIIEKLLNSSDSTALILTPTRELANQINEFIKQITINDIKLKSVLLIGGDSIDNQISLLNGEAPRRSRGRQYMGRGAKRSRDGEFQNNDSNDSNDNQNLEPKVKPRIIVATPGRVIDHLERKSLKLSNCKFLVLDETDRMLDMGFGLQLDEILRYVSKDRQTLMFTATWPNAVDKISKNYLVNPKRVTIGSVVAPVTKIKQEFRHVTTEGEKYLTLVEELKTRKGSIIVFVKTREGSETLTTKLNKDEQLTAKFKKNEPVSDTTQEEKKPDREDRRFSKFGKRRRDDGFNEPQRNIRFINGDLQQNKRTKLIQDFRDEKYSILIATEVVARGLDIAHLQHVINYDLPECGDDYIHRIGRTGRAGAEGNALSIISPNDKKKWYNIDRLVNPEKYTGRDRQDRQGDTGRSYNSGFKRSKFANNNSRDGDSRDSRDSRDSSRDSRDSRSNRDSRDFGNDKGKKTGFFSNTSNFKSAKPAARPARAKAY